MFTFIIVLIKLNINAYCISQVHLCTMVDQNLDNISVASQCCIVDHCPSIL